MRRGKTVYQYKDNQLIAYYPSIAEAARQVGVDRKEIRLVLYGRENRKTVRGCVFSFHYPLPQEVNEDD